MAYKVIILYQLYMPSYFLGTFTEYPFIALPGGWGTLEEITEVITLKQLGQHNKPIVFLNTAGYYKLFFEFIEHSRKAKFISSAYDHLYYIADAVEPALDYIQKYQPIPQVKKY